MQPKLMPIGTRVIHFDDPSCGHGFGTVIGYNGVKPNAYLEEKGAEALVLAAKADLLAPVFASTYDGVRCPYVVRWDRNPEFFRTHPHLLIRFPNMQFEEVYGAELTPVESTIYRTYVSRRGFPLLYVGKPMAVPVLTLENYTKWYGIYLVMPDGTVQGVNPSDIESMTTAYLDAIWADHLYSPHLLYRLAKHLRAELDERAMEVAIGRWLLESGKYDAFVNEQKFAY